MKWILWPALLTTVASAESVTLDFGKSRVQLTSDGNIGRIYRDADTMKEIEFLLAETPVPKDQNVWEVKTFIFRKTDAEWMDGEGKKRRTKAEMSEEDVKGLVQAAKDFARAVEAYTGRRLRLEQEIKVFDEPLTKVAGGNGTYLAWHEATDERIGAFVKEGRTDSVIVTWIPSEIPVGIYWGGTIGGNYRGAGYTSVQYLHPGTTDFHSYFEVTLHEWLHQTEWSRGFRMGYTGLPDLHMAGEMGYVSDAPSRGWMDYYRDFMGVYHTPRTWRKMRQFADDPDRKKPVGDGGFCREWLVCGPFPNENDGGLDVAFIDETGRGPAAGDAAAGRRWEAKKSDTDVMDLNGMFAPNDNVVAYLNAYVESDAEREAILWVGSDDGVYAWWNGRRVHRNHSHRGCQPDADAVAVKLRKGWNRLLLKVDEGDGGWAACARLSDKAGAVLPLKWASARPGADVPRDDAALAVTYRSWDDVADDPWRILPAWGESELREITGLPKLALRAGRSSLLVDPGEDRPGLRRTPDPDDARLDNQLNFARESLARIGDLWLVRADVAPFLDARLAAGKPKYIAWIQAGNRPALVASLPAAHARQELELLLDRRDGIEFDLSTSPTLLVGGRRGTASLKVRNAGAAAVDLKDLALKSHGNVTVGPEQAPSIRLQPGDEFEHSWEITPPADIREPSTAILVVSSGGYRDAAAVDLRDAWTVQVLTPTGRPADRALRGKLHPVIVRITSNLDQPASGTLTLSGPADWFDPDAATVPFQLAPFAACEIPFSLMPPEAWDGTAAVRFTASPAPNSPAELRERSAALAFDALPWTFEGPYPNADHAGFKTVYPPEKNATPKSPAAFDAGPPGLASLSRVNLRGLFPPGDDAAAYAWITVVSPEAKDAQLRLGSDDTLTAWWNGEKVVSKDVYRAAAPDQDVVNVKLKKGVNRLRLKVCQGGGGWEFYFRMTDREGAEIKGLEYRSK